MAKKEDVEVLQVWEPHEDRPTKFSDRVIRDSDKSKKKKVLLVGILAFFAIFVYAVFAQPLAHNAKQITNTWNISFTDMYLQEKQGNVTELSSPSYNSTKANFYISMTGSGDKITYDLTITNSGSLDAEVDSIYIIPENQPGDSILYYTNGIDVGDILKAGESTHLTVTAAYNPSATSSSSRKDMSVIINYKQKD